MPEQKPTISLLRSVRSRMLERYIFNFRLRPDDLARKLPVPWLEPQVSNGWSVISFCILWLDDLSLPPLPVIGDSRTISCAYRIGVIDRSTPVPEPSVYVTDRWADLPLIARLAPWVLFDTIPVIRAAIGHAGETTHVQMSYQDGVHLFSAETRPAADGMGSEVFGSVDEFAGFIKEGVSSYAPSIYPDVYSKVDLEKEDVGYEPLDATIEYNEIDQIWTDVELHFDSAVRARGAKYEWTYRGLWK